MYFLNINKPKGITSFDVIRKLRQRLKIKQIGHSGTLDPLATGVLQVAIGSATKLLNYLKADKTYIAKMKFGYITDTFDIEGEKTFIKEPDFDLKQLKDVLDSFVGKTMQTPPKFSAIKINGQKACDIIRKNPNQQIQISPRQIEIYSIELIDFKDYEAEIKVYCKKGTYIRSLINDIGQKLACGAYMTELTRIQAGNFEIKNSNNLDDEILNKINPLDALEFEKIELDDAQYSKIINGNPIEAYGKYGKIVLLTKENKLVSIADLSDNLIKPKKVFKGV